MKTMVLWLLLAVPTEKCINAVRHDNLGECHEEMWYDDGYLPAHREPSVGQVTVCGQVKDPKPLPQEKTLVSTDPFALKSDGCYEIYRSSVVLSTGDPYGPLTISFISTVPFSSGIFFAPAATAGERAGKSSQKKP